MAEAYYEYLDFNGDSYFTVVVKPSAEGKFPVIVCRNPYVKRYADAREEDIVADYLRGAEKWLENGYAVVNQHCRGQGKSSGAFVPYVHEREDGLALREWIRKQPFYNGEIYLLGGSYSSSLHYATAPFESDVKGAILEIQDSERYRLWYRNGQMRKGHANWHFGLYKDKCSLNKTFNMSSFAELPLKGLSERVLGDLAEDFEQMLEAPRTTDPFWQTRNGGVDARDAVTDANIPILLTTGYNDFYVGGVFDMWRRLTDRTREKSALLVSPYDHGDGFSESLGICFPDGRRREGFGADYQIAWFNNVRKGTPIPFEKGVISYYRAFENRWESDFYRFGTDERRLSIGCGEASFEYDPKDPPAFRCEGLMAEELDRRDVVTLYTEPFSDDTFVKGRMRLSLCVSSDRPDTSFYARISIDKGDHAYVLRHDITSLIYALGDYTVGERVALEMVFDEYAFLVMAGERLRIDVSSTDDNTYVSHTNMRGAYHLQTETAVAVNTVYLSESSLVLPVEDREKGR